MKKLWPFLFLFNLNGQTNVFRVYPQPQPAQAYTSANLMPMLKTADGGYIFSCNPYSQQASVIDYYTIKTNSIYTPQWKKKVYARSIALPTGGIITINIGDAKKTIIEKFTSSGKTVWAKEILSPITFTGVSASNVFSYLSCGVAYNNKFRVIGSTYVVDFTGAVTDAVPFSAELDTTFGNIISSVKFNITSTSTFTPAIYSFNNISIDNQGSFYASGNNNAGIVKFSPNFTFMWQLSWPNRSLKPSVNSIKFLPNGDLFCSMSYYDTINLKLRSWNHEGYKSCCCNI